MGLRKYSILSLPTYGPLATSLSIFQVLSKAPRVVLLWSLLRSSCTPTPPSGYPYASRLIQAPDGNGNAKAALRSSALHKYDFQTVFLIRSIAQGPKAREHPPELDRSYR